MPWGCQNAFTVDRPHPETAHPTAHKNYTDYLVAYRHGPVDLAFSVEYIAGKEVGLGVGMGDG